MAVLQLIFLIYSENQEVVRRIGFIGLYRNQKLSVWAISAYRTLSKSNYRTSLISVLYFWRIQLFNLTFGFSAGVAEPVSVTDNGEGIHTVNYTPANDGPYTVCVKYAEQEVPRRSVALANVAGVYIFPQSRKS